MTLRRTKKIERLTKQKNKKVDSNAFALLPICAHLIHTK